MKNLRVLILLVSSICLTVSLVACGGQNRSGAAGIEVKDAWVRVVQMGGAPLGAPPMSSTPMGGQQAMGTPGAGMMSTPGSGMGSGVQGGLGNGAAYMTVVNQTGVADRLLRVESDVAQAVELHISEVKNDIMTMRPVEAIDLPAGGQVELKPGGYHIMLVGLARQLKPGDKVTFTLVFEKAGAVKVEAEVRAA